MSAKRQPIVIFAIATLAVIGFAVVALNVGWKAGVVPICDEPQEHTAVSPDGRNVVLLGIANCGTDRFYLTAKLVGSSDTSPLFSGYARSRDMKLDARWDSATDLSISYSHGIDVQYPPSGRNTDGIHDFGAVQVRYAQH